MAIIPGVTGQKAELFDGAKIDAISEYTVGNGVQLQGRTSGVAIEAGKVGELYAVDSVSPSISSNQTDYPLTSRVLPAGRWMIIVSVIHGSQGVAMSFGGLYKLKSNGSYTTGAGAGTWGVDKMTLGYYQASGHIGFCNSSAAICHAGLNLDNSKTVTVTVDYTSGSWSGTGYPTVTVQYLRIA